MPYANAIAHGEVVSLAVNGDPVHELYFHLDGPEADRHRGFMRRLSGHDGDYIRTSERNKGDLVLNHRSWTGISTEEMAQMEHALNVKIPIGCLLENITFSDIPSFSDLPPMTRLVFSSHDKQQAILFVLEKNGPCITVGRRLAEHHGRPELTSMFVNIARNRRGLMGVVFSQGWVEVGDDVRVYPPLS